MPIVLLVRMGFVPRKRQENTPDKVNLGKMHEEDKKAVKESTNE